MPEPPKLRSIHFLTPEQLKKKRDGDRFAQRQKRERMKADIDALRQQVQELRERNQVLENQMSSTTISPQTTFFQSDNATSDSGVDVRSEKRSDCVVAQSEAVMGAVGTETSLLPCISSAAREGETPDTEIWQMLCGNLPDLDLTLWPGFLSTDDDQPGISPLDHTSFECSSLRISSSTAPSPVQVLATSHVWAAMPRHTAPTCLLDNVLLDLTRQRRQQDNAREFQKRIFPAIQSLLNPCSEQHAKNSPVTFAIVNKIIRVMTVPTLPEQIAILHVMSAVVRWLILPTEANYDAMPEWLRPGAAQLAVPHAPWLDLFVWPKARERLCRWQKYHCQHELMSAICNESLSINWPHRTTDIILQCNGGEAMLNPIFDRHINNVDNWTIGKRMLQVFPELEGEVNVK